MYWCVVPLGSERIFAGRLAWRVRARSDEGICGHMCRLARERATRELAPLVSYADSDDNDMRHLLACE
jgi:hypothetical protein